MICQVVLMLLLKKGYAKASFEFLRSMTLTEWSASLVVDVRVWDEKQKLIAKVSATLLRSTPR